MWAVIIADLNSSDLGEIVSRHRTEAAAEKAATKIDARGAYVARMKSDGEWERRLEARDRRERGPVDDDSIGRLARCGRALYGERWQSDLARALGVGDRRVRQWLGGERGIPAGIWADIAALLRHQQHEAAALLRDLDVGQ